MASRVSAEKKITLLKVIQEKKQILFGKFSDEIDHNKKVAAWKEVLVIAKSLEIVSEQRDWTYVRDTIWGQWRSRALKKRDNRKQTGTGGGSKNVLTDVDLLIIDILGGESPVVEGLNIGESQRPSTPVNVPNSSALAVTMSSASAPTVSSLSVPTVSSVSAPTVSATPPTTNSTASQLFVNGVPAGGIDERRNRKRKLFVQRDNDESTDEKRALQKELMKAKIYKHRLEILKLERELDLPNSEFTLEFSHESK